MYLPAHFAETRAEVLHELIRTQPLATLVTLGSAGLVANHIPLQWQPGAGAASPGVLRGHVARGNTLWSDRIEDVEVLAIFQGPQHYISPSWYPTKQEHGKVVPTWNYCTVHVHGRLQVHQDPGWIRAQVSALTAQQEAPMASPWAVADAPAEYLEKMLAQIVGIEIAITRLAGKWKTSQNQPPANRAGVVAGLDAQGGEAALAMAELVRRLAPGAAG